MAPLKSQKNTQLIKRDIEKQSVDNLFNNLELLLKYKTLDKEQIKMFYRTYHTLIKNKQDSAFSKVFDKILNTPKLHKHQFNVENKIIVSDPSYTKRKVDTRGKIMDVNYIAKVKAGTWLAYYHSWIKPNPNILVAVHKDHVDDKTFECVHIKDLGVDSGTMTIMDEARYPNYEQLQDQLLWAEKNAFPSKFHKNTTAGYSVTSGYGDGLYKCLACKKNGVTTKIIVCFLP